MSQNVEIRESLKAAPLFREFTPEEIDQFIELLDPLRVEGGECIVKQDETGEEMFLMVSGRARVVHHLNGRDVELAEMQPGDFFGELALVDHGVRSADVEALEESTLLVISRASLSALAGVYPKVAFKFLIGIGRIMVDRMRKSNQRYIDSMLFSKVGKE